MPYYILSEDLMTAGSSGIGTIPNDIEPLDWTRGKVMRPPPSPLRLGLSENSGETRNDIIESLVTLYSDKVKNALTTFGVDNVDYCPVELEGPQRGAIERGYWLANVIGLAECVDLGRSDVKTRASGRGLVLKSFVLDEARVAERHIFRLREKATLVIVNEPLKIHLSRFDLVGVRFLPTEQYDGY